MKFRLLLAFIFAFAFIQGCATKNQPQEIMGGEYDELFKDDGNFVPINSAEIQRQIEEVR